MSSTKPQSKRNCISGDDHELVIRSDGTLVFIYNDDLREIMSLGDTKIARASHVEPSPEGKWIADLTPVGGSVFGPFETRREALQYEAEWLIRNGIPTSDQPLVAVQ